MLATLGGILALLAGLTVLLVSLLVPELSRPRDAFWGALVLLLGLVLVTSAERLSGAPMLAVLCGGLLIGRLGTEVSLGRWRQLSDEERQRFWAQERWRTSLSQLGATLAQLVNGLQASSSSLGGWLKQRMSAKATQSPQVTKRWVRPEPSEQESAVLSDPPLTVVSSFEEVDVLVQQAIKDAQDHAPSTETKPVEPEP
ncbi:hypothetical protein KBY66_13190 [Synechococcus sp. Tobar12-5m-g]|uniref:Ycf66 family protein n=1 Tax=unclassified Synechococcus TaxID=2626047 RepID=UPI0020CC0D7C|nr:MULTISPECIES: Ycf66 family protein [unclassified Synechococcus]MCP9773556.1 hypothetical protein [Synechococcus sp. Tobar12-5m-g]MCP9874523.1 hypothetical protein [Synechococcus sp. Cruz CV-v-12]